MQHSPTVHLDLGVDIIYDLGVSDDGDIRLYLQMEANGHEVGDAPPISLTEAVDEMHSGLKQDGEYQLLYIAAHELRRLSEELYESARNIEASDEVVLGRYNVDTDEGLPE